MIGYCHYGARQLRRTKYTWSVNTHVQYSGRCGNTQRVGGEDRVLEVEFGVLLVGDLLVTPVARLNLLQSKVSEFPNFFLGILLSEFRFSVFFPQGSGFMNPPPSVFSNRDRKSSQRGLGRSLERKRRQYNFFVPP